jgi:hypothetical protein
MPLRNFSGSSIIITCVPAASTSRFPTCNAPAPRKKDTAKSRIAYQNFFAADPDIPILKQARAEYATLQAIDHLLNNSGVVYPVCNASAADGAVSITRPCDVCHVFRRCTKLL